MTTAIAAWGYIAENEHLTDWLADVEMADPHSLLAWLSR
jgi:phosphoglycolate phosphatase